MRRLKNEIRRFHWLQKPAELAILDNAEFLKIILYIINENGSQNLNKKYISQNAPLSSRQLLQLLSSYGLHNIGDFKAQSCHY